MFKEERDTPLFNWDMLGDVDAGRPNLGPETDVRVYRLMQYTLRDIMIKDFGPETADRIFREAGRLAGNELCKASFDTTKDFNGFVKDVEELLLNLKIGILRLEEADLEKMHFTLTVAEDLDCSGLPVCEETICTYDEGFISGLLEAYSGHRFETKEVDCWCSGDRVCRFVSRKI